jgi:hypothetical protein
VIDLVLVAQIVTMAPQTAVTYAAVPPEVTRIALFELRSQGPPQTIDVAADRPADRAVIRGEPQRSVVVSFAREDGRYLLDGPFAWPASDVTRTLDRRWRRTLARSATARVSGIASMEWIDVAIPGQSVWPMCFVVADAGARCWGVADGQRGVAVGRGADGLAWAVVSDDRDVVWRESKWGRLVIVRDRQDGREPPQIRFGRPVVPSSGRTAGVRLKTSGVDGALSVPIDRAAVWIAGSDLPPDSWLELSTSRAGPSFVSLHELASGPASLPASILLPDRRVLAGVIVGVRNEPASGALLTVFRLIDPEAPAAGDQRRKSRRVFAAETIATAGGTFQIEALGDDEYEAVAFHPQLGRATVAVRDAHGDMRIRLQAPGLIRGRVLSGGKPAADVEVISAPDPDAFRNADDPLDVKGGDTRSGPDGRFVVMAAPSGGGELRIGGGRLPVRRVPLPRVPLPVLDLGDIDLGSPIALTVVLDQDTPCGVRATGPIGHSGLQIIMASKVGPGLFQIVLPESGAWNFGLLCGREGRPLSPAVVPIGREHAGKEVRLAIR